MYYLCTIIQYIVMENKKVMYQNKIVYLSTLTDAQIEKIAKKIRTDFKFDNHTNYCTITHKVTNRNYIVGTFAQYGGFKMDSRTWRHLFAHIEHLYTKEIDATKNYLNLETHPPFVVDVRKGYVHELCYEVIRISCGFKPLKLENYKEALIQNWR